MVHPRACWTAYSALPNLAGSTWGRFVKQDQWECWQAELKYGVWVQALGAIVPHTHRRPCWSGSGRGSPILLWGLGGITPETFWDFICKILQSSALVVRKWTFYSSVVFLWVLKHFNNGNTVPMHSGSFSTMGTSFPHIPSSKCPWLNH